jgi:hypothetical protein
VIGRVFWDQWLVWKAGSMGAAVVDASEAVMAIHQNHDYGYHAAGGELFHGAAARGGPFDLFVPRRMLGGMDTPGCLKAGWINSKVLALPTEMVLGGGNYFVIAERLTANSFFSLRAPR